MKEISKQVEEAMKESIKLEINGRKFFDRAADVTENEKGKKMFRFLAAEEVKHMEVFGDLFSKILGGSDWRQYVPSAKLQGESPLVEKLKERIKKDERPSEI